MPIERTKNLLPLIVALFIYWAITAVLVYRSFVINEGNLIYPLDDTYIHMAIAKNTVLHHVWGITKYEFSSSSSSPLWTALLTATYFLFGVNQWAPLALNLVFGSALVVSVYLLFMRRKGGLGIGQFIVLIAIVLCTPLPALTIIGMEHTLHTWLSVFFISCTFLFFCEQTPKVWLLRVSPYVLGALLVLSRYEGIFLVLSVAFVLIFCLKRIREALLLILVSIMPIGLYGLWCVKQGWFAIPNSVLLKSKLYNYSITQMLFLGLQRIYLSSHICPLVLCLGILLLIIVFRGISFSVAECFLLAIFCTVLLHMQFIGIHWFYRYEAYLVALGCVTLTLFVASEKNRNDSFARLYRYRFYRLLPVFLICVLFLPGYIQ